MSNKIQIKRGLKANLPILDAGEPAFTTDTKKFFVGDGKNNIEFAKQADLEVINNQVSDLNFQTAGGTGTSITLKINQIMTNGLAVTFIASTNNSGAATTINGKPLYKPNTKTVPNLMAGKAYTVWYSSTGDCFFIKASAEGDADVSHVLASKKFSNDNDTGLTGTMPNNGAINYNIPINGSFTIPLGYTTGGKITQSITTKSEQTYNPSTTAQIIASGQYLSGSQTIAPVTGNATINDVVSGKVFSSANGINLVGNATIASLGGFHIISGSISPSFSGNGSVTITTPGPPIAVFGIYRRDTTTWPFTYSVTGDFGIPIYDIYIPYLGISISGNTITFSGTVSINKINWVAIYK